LPWEWSCWWWLPWYSHADANEHDRKVYASAYSDPEAIRAGNGWYQAFQQDIADEKIYRQLNAPILAPCGRWAYQALRTPLPEKAHRVEVVLVENSGHHIAEEQPGTVIAHLTEFFG
jgi:pimeloyl-ACP methyl ester carboxylesterase